MTYKTPNGAFGTGFIGDLVKRVDPDGNTTCYAYDALHRVTAITYPSGPYVAATPQKHFVYDGATVNGVGMANAKARLAEAKATNEVQLRGGFRAITEPESENSGSRARSSVLQTDST